MILEIKGTSKTDFLEQVEGEDAFDMEKFTIIAPESPGWGRSRPPLRPYGGQVYDNDVECFYQLMRVHATNRSIKF